MSLSSLLRGTADSLDRRVGWDKLPLPAGLLTLVGLRQRLREENLHDTGRGALDVPPIDDHDGYLTARTLDGTFNDLNDPLMGSLGAASAATCRSRSPTGSRPTRCSTRARASSAASS